MISMRGKTAIKARKLLQNRYFAQSKASPLQFTDQQRSFAELALDLSVKLATIAYVR